MAADQDHDPVGDIDALLSEERTFHPSREFREDAIVRDPAVYEQAERDPDGRPATT